MKNSNSKDGTEVPQSTEDDVTTSCQTPNKDFVQWLTEDALPMTKNILSQLKKLSVDKNMEQKLNSIPPDGAAAQKQYEAEVTPSAYFVKIKN